MAPHFAEIGEFLNPISKCSEYKTSQCFSTRAMVSAEPGPPKAKLRMALESRSQVPPAQLWETPVPSTVR